MLSLGVLASCGDGADGRATDDLPTTAEQPAPTPSPTPSVEFLMNTAVYHSGDESDGWYEARLDVYAPVERGDGDLPVVVMFHGAPGVIEKASLHNVAEATAERGAVVFVPNWGNFRWGDDPDAARSRGLMTMDAAACAVSYAVVHAAEYGGDPERLALLGNSAGASPAALAGLRTAEPFPLCAVEPQAFVPDTVVLWEGDWLLATIVWDRFGDGLPTVMEAYTPWTWLDQPARPAVVVATTAGGRALEKRCEASATAPWLATRDPDGSLARRLETLGAFDDGCLDVAEPTAVLAAVMREKGFAVEELMLPESSHTSLRRADLATLLDALFAGLDPG